MDKLEAAAVIPARWASTRLPGKVLADLGGKPVLRRVWENCSGAGVFSRVIVAADHDRVKEAAAAFGAEVVMTDPSLASGTERVAAVAAKLTEAVVVNVQGDEPFINETVLKPLVEMALRMDADVATPVTAVTKGAELADPSVVKVVVNTWGEALYFSRWPIPFHRDAWSGDNPLAAAGSSSPMDHGFWWRHLGVYAFRRQRLLEFVGLPPCRTEEHEKLEQLRWLHHGARILCLPVPHRGISIDTAADLEAARRLLKI